MRPSSQPSPSSSQPLSPAVISRRVFTVRALLAAVGGASLLRTTADGQQPQAVDPNAPRPLAENVSLRDLMTPEQFRAAGLKKLSPEELGSLERFLKGYRDQTVQTATKQIEERVAPTGNRTQAADRSYIESRIKGDFEGLKGRTRMILENGSMALRVKRRKCGARTFEMRGVRAAYGPLKDSSTRSETLCVRARGIIIRRSSVVVVFVCTWLISSVAAPLGIGAQYAMYLSAKDGEIKNSSTAPTYPHQDRFPVLLKHSPRLNIPDPTKLLDCSIALILAPEACRPSPAC